MVLFAATFLLSAQRGGSRPRGKSGAQGGKYMSMEARQAQELDTLTKVLSLTDEQVEKVKALQEKQQKAFEENRASMSENTDRDAMREKMEAMRKQYDTDLKALLTDEQAEKYEAYQTKRKEEMKKRMKEGRGPGGPGGPGGPPPF